MNKIKFFRNIAPKLTSSETNVRKKDIPGDILFGLVKVLFNSWVVVELGLTGLTSTSQNSRTTASSPLRYSGPVFQS